MPLISLLTGMFAATFDALRQLLDRWVTPRAASPVPPRKGRLSTDEHIQLALRRYGASSPAQGRASTPWGASDCEPRKPDGNRGSRAFSALRRTTSGKIGRHAGPPHAAVIAAIGFAGTDATSSTPRSGVLVSALCLISAMVVLASVAACLSLGLTRQQHTAALNESGRHAQGELLADAER